MGINSELMQRKYLNQRSPFHGWLFVDTNESIWNMAII